MAKARKRIVILKQTERAQLLAHYNKRGGRATLITSTSKYIDGAPFGILRFWR